MLRWWRRRILFIFLVKDAHIWRLMLPLMGLLPFFDAAAFTSDWCGCEDMVAIALYCPCAIYKYVATSKRTSEIEIWELKDLAAGSKEINRIYRQLGILFPFHQLIVCVTMWNNPSFTFSRIFYYNCLTRQSVTSYLLLLCKFIIIFLHYLPCSLQRSCDNLQKCVKIFDNKIFPKSLTVE